MGMGVAIFRATAQREGMSLDVTVACAVKFDDQGKQQEGWYGVIDQTAWDDFYAAQPLVHKVVARGASKYRNRSPLPHAWLGGDLEAWGKLAADDIVIHMRGKPTLNGSYRGREGVLEFFGKFAALDIDGMTMEIDDVFADDRFAVAMMRSVYKRGTETLELMNACAYKIDADGKICEVWNVLGPAGARARILRIPRRQPSP